MPLLRNLFHGIETPGSALILPVNQYRAFGIKPARIGILANEDLAMVLLGLGTYGQDRAHPSTCYGYKPPHTLF